MTNANSLNSPDFLAWEEQMAEPAMPYGADMLIPQAAPSEVERTLACANPGDYAIMDVDPIDIAAIYDVALTR
jgi:hypothetical protein